MAGFPNIPNNQVFESNFGLIYTVDPLTAVSTAHVGTANRAQYYRVQGSGTISKIGLEVVTSSGNIDVGVYANSGEGRNATPGDLKASSGSVACPASGYAEVALSESVTVQPGDWLAISADNTTATFRALGSTISPIDLFAGRSGHENTAFPLPSTATMSVSLHSPKLLVGVA